MTVARIAATTEATGARTAALDASDRQLTQLEASTNARGANEPSLHTAGGVLLELTTIVLVVSQK
jgi:hypothetical protein